MTPPSRSTARTRSDRAPATYATQAQHADTLRRRGDSAGAIRAFHALTLQHPTRSDAFSNLGAMLQAAGHPMPALTAIARAIELDPQSVPALANSAEILKDFGEWQVVLDTYDAALARTPHAPGLRFARGLHLLMLDRWEEGWREHEQRRHVPDMPLGTTPLRSPVWDGSPLQGRRIMLDGEQGLGDQVMFARFSAAVAARGGEVLLRCGAPLVPLLAGLRGTTQVVSSSDPVPEHDVHASLMSLPHLLSLRSSTALDGGAYLTPAGACPDHIRTALSGRSPRVGLVWRGNPQHRNDARRSIAPELLLPMVTTPGVTFISLQRHDVAAAMPTVLAPHLTDLGPGLATCNDTAHALCRLDLLVTVDTAVAHIAGALGVPTLLLVPFVPDWRWMTCRADTPWYHSLTLVRQSTIFEWPDVVEAARLHVAGLGTRP